MSIAVILNPIAGRGQGAKMKAEIAAALPDATIHETQRSGEATELAGVCTAAGASIIIVAGGDGTLGEVLNGMIGSPAKLGILPVGTGNDFARTLGIGADFQLALETIQAGHCRPVDVGLVEIGERSRFFLNVAGAGFDSRCAARINEHRPAILSKLSGPTAYIVAVLAEMSRYETHRLRLELDDQIVESSAILCAIANAQSYGGGMKVAPGARLDDGLFDICLVKDLSALDFLRTFPGVFSGKHIHHPKVEVLRAAKVKLESEKPLPVLVDGDILGVTPASFTMKPRGIEVLCPAPQN